MACEQAAGRSPRFSWNPVTIVLALAAPIVATALLHVWVEVTALRLGYELSEASEVHRRRVEENRGLRVELETLRSTRRLERVGRDRLSLRTPDPAQIVRVRAEVKP